MVMDGGLLAWEAAGYPLQRSGAWSLERQVRFTAGLLVMAGMIPGVLVHPAFLALAGLVGAGLVFSGITDTCGMGMLLAKMPWNRAQIPAQIPAACALQRAPASGETATGNHAG